MYLLLRVLIAMVSKLHLGAAAAATAGFVLAMHTVHTYAYRISSYSFRP